MGNLRRCDRCHVRRSVGEFNYNSCICGKCSAGITTTAQRGEPMSAIIMVGDRVIDARIDPQPNSRHLKKAILSHLPKLYPHTGEQPDYNILFVCAQDDALHTALFNAPTRYTRHGLGYAYEKVKHILAAKLQQVNAPRYKMRYKWQMLKPAARVEE